MARRYKLYLQTLAVKMRPGIATVKFLPNKIVAPSHTGNSSASKMKSEASPLVLLSLFLLYSAASVPRHCLNA